MPGARKPLIERFWEKVDKSGPIVRAELGPCWAWRGATRSGGYGVLGRGRRGEGIVRAHRLSWEIQNGSIPSGLDVLHKCDNPPCCNPAHLFLGTDADNTADKVAKGRATAPCGEQNGKSKLTTEAVQRVRELHRRGLGHKRIAGLIGVNRETVRAVLRGRTWSHVPDGGVS